MLQRDREIYNDFGQRVDIDRYDIEGRTTPVVVGVRELGDQASLSWEVRHAVRTHGYGLVLAPANDANATGEPNFLIGDAPLNNQLEEQVFIDQPQVYFGEGIDQYAVTGTTSGEFDPDGAEYTGDGGIPMSSLLSRLAFSFRFGAIEPLISGIVTDETEVIFARDVTERARRVAPFLQFDSNPYPVVVDGGISYVIDAYTTSDRFPYSEFANIQQLPSDSGLLRNFNYVRNSVKVVVDGYDGDVDFYVVDPDDPILNSYRQVFGDLFQSASAMPEEISTHLRYPEDLFIVQTGMWGRYYLDNVSDFFSGDLAWAVADNSDSQSAGTAITRIDRTDPANPRIVPDRSRPVDPYYQLTRLPDEDEVSFLISRPFVPAGGLRELTSYFVGRTDETGQLELREYEMSTGGNVLVTGPFQVDETLNADPRISEESTELGQSGSQFLSGNLQVLLIEDTVVYVRPFFVRREPPAENPNQITEPEVTFVAVVQGDRIGFAPTYAGALAELFNLTPEETTALLGGAPPLLGQAPTDDGSDLPSGSFELGAGGGELAARLAEVLAMFDAAEEALPDFAEFDRLQSEAREALEELEGLLNQIEAEDAELETVEDEEETTESA